MLPLFMQTMLDTPRNAPHGAFAGRFRDHGDDADRWIFGFAL